jgi:hypothetical protein
MAQKRSSKQNDASTSGDDTTMDSESEQTADVYDTSDDHGGHLRYLVGGAESLPLIAESYGHSGEWQALLNENPDIPDWNNLQRGQVLNLPTEWIPSRETEEETQSTTSGEESETTTDNEMENATTDNETENKSY